MYEELGISEKVYNTAKEVEKELESIFEKLDENCMKASCKVLKAFPRCSKGVCRRLHEVLKNRR